MKYAPFLIVSVRTVNLSSFSFSSLVSPTLALGTSFGSHLCQCPKLEGLQGNTLCPSSMWAKRVRMSWSKGMRSDCGIGARSRPKSTCRAGILATNDGMIPTDVSRSGRHRVTDSHFVNRVESGIQHTRTEQHASRHASPKASLSEGSVSSEEGVTHLRESCTFCSA